MLSTGKRVAKFVDPCSLMSRRMVCCPIVLLLFIWKIHVSKRRNEISTSVYRGLCSNYDLSALGDEN